MNYVVLVHGPEFEKLIEICQQKAAGRRALQTCVLLSLIESWRVESKCCPQRSMADAAATAKFSKGAPSFRPPGSKLPTAVLPSEWLAAPPTAALTFVARSLARKLCGQQLDRH